MGEKHGTGTRRGIVASATALLVATVAGCMTTGEVKETAGGLAGAGIGGLIGNQIGSGSRRALATLAGAAIGTLVGVTIARKLDEGAKAKSRAAVSRALETDSAIQWDAPDNRGGPAAGHVEITRRGTRDGRTCREFRQTVRVGDDEEEAYGTACRDAAGDWQIVQSG